MWVFITMTLAFAGGYVGIKRKIPAGALLCSLLAVAALSIATGRAEFPQQAKFFAQASTGAYLGAKISKSDIEGLKYAIVPSIILCLCMVFLSITMGFLMAKYTNMDIVTALFAVAPGGLADTVLISMDFGADVGQVVVLQLVRMLTIVTIIPQVIKIIVSKVNKNNQNIYDNSSKLNKDSSIAKQVDKYEQLIKICKTLIIGIVAGAIGNKLKVPAGAISFSMAACAFYNIKTGNGYIPLNLRQTFQMLAGALIGVKITMTAVMEMINILPSVVLVILGFVLLNIIAAFLIYKFSKFDIITALFSAAAGGIADVAIIADEMGADTTKVAAVHLIRIMMVIGVYPILIKMLLGV